MILVRVRVQEFLGFEFEFESGQIARVQRVRVYVPGIGLELVLELGLELVSGLEIELELSSSPRPCPHPTLANFRWRKVLKKITRLRVCLVLVYIDDLVITVAVDLYYKHFNCLLKDELCENIFKSNLTFYVIYLPSSYYVTSLY